MAHIVEEIYIYIYIREHLIHFNETTLTNESKIYLFKLGFASIPLKLIANSLRWGNVRFILVVN